MTRFSTPIFTITGIFTFEPSRRSIKNTQPDSWVPTQAANKIGLNTPMAITRDSFLPNIAIFTIPLLAGCLCLRTVQAEYRCCDS